MNKSILKVLACAALATSSLSIAMEDEATFWLRFLHNLRQAMAREESLNQSHQLLPQDAVKNLQPSMPAHVTPYTGDLVSEVGPVDSNSDRFTCICEKVVTPRVIMSAAAVSCLIYAYKKGYIGKAKTKIIECACKIKDKIRHKFATKKEVKNLQAKVA
jgi:hypothetical protein